MSQTHRLTAAAIMLALCVTLSAPAGAQMGQRMLELASHPASEAERAQARAALPADPDRKLAYVHPQDADPRISQFLQDHVVITDPAVPANGKLLVFLPGTFARPVGYQLFLDTAARLGFHAIGLEYVDAGGVGSSTVMQICGRGQDLQCFGSVRAARAFGGQAADGQTVAPPDGIVSRLATLLAYLARTQPQAGWAAFVSGGKPDWSHIVLAGHSQGAGMAAFLAKTYPLAGVALISGGADGNIRTRQPADWVRQPSATPPARWYAMANASEPREQALMLGLAALGVPGPPTEWAGPAAMNGSHIALVDQDPRAQGKHESTAGDMATPLGQGGAPAYAPVWRFMLLGG